MDIRDGLRVALLQGRQVKTIFLCIAMVVGLGGCDLLAARYVDASADDVVREIASTSRTTKADLLLLGIDSYPSKKKIENYVLVQPPGFDGPEVLSKSLLPKGARLHFMGAQRCVNCYPQNLRISIKVDGLSVTQPVYIDISLIESL